MPARHVVPFNYFAVHRTLRWHSPASLVSSTYFCPFKMRAILLMSCTQRETVQPMKLQLTRRSL